MMSMGRLLLASVLFCCVGCSNRNSTSDGGAQVNHGPIESGPAVPDTVSLDELKSEIARHRDNSKWYFGARPDGEPVGTWLSQDGDREPLTFEQDGSFKCGMVWRNGAGSLAAGRYAISEKGLIVAVAKHSSGARLGLFYYLDNGTIKGSRGPAPKVEWKRNSPGQP